MNATLDYEPYRVPAGLLALAMHGAFFALLYFGFTWQTRPAETMSVELWQSLPEQAVPAAAPAPAPAPPKVAEAVQPAQPKKLIKPDIALPDKKNKKKIEPKPDVAIPEKKKPVLSPVEAVETQPAPQTTVEQKTAEKSPGDQIAAQQAEQAARDRAAQDAAIEAMVNEYKAKIVTKVRRNIVKPPNVPDDARAEFRVTLLPGGTVLSAELKRSSGNAAYDNAVERAILKSQPLPLPADVAMFNRFRVLLLVFKPVE